MSTQTHIELDLPPEVVAALGERDLSSKIKEALVMELLREHRFSQGKAAELLGVSRYELFDLMTHYQVPVIDLTADELDEELNKPLPQFQ